MENFYFSPSRNFTKLTCHVQNLDSDKNLQKEAVPNGQLVQFISNISKSSNYIFCACIYHKACVGIKGPEQDTHAWRHT